jgi:hypothetical protein
MTEEQLLIAEKNLITEIDAVIAEMTTAGRLPPVEWVLQAMLGRHPMPPDLLRFSGRARSGACGS